MFGGDMRVIVAGGIIGLGVGVVVGGAVGYRVGVYSTWRLVTRGLRKATVDGR
jgi:hypothetical protein